MSVLSEKPALLFFYVKRRQAEIAMKKESEQTDNLQATEKYTDTHRQKVMTQFEYVGSPDLHRL